MRNAPAATRPGPLPRQIPGLSLSLSFNLKAFHVFLVFGGKQSSHLKESRSSHHQKKKRSQLLFQVRGTAGNFHEGTKLCTGLLSGAMSPVVRKTVPSKRDFLPTQNLSVVYQKAVGHFSKITLYLEVFKANIVVHGPLRNRDR